MVDDELVVYPELHAVIGVGVEVIGFGIFRLHLAGPADGVITGSVGDGDDCAVGPVEIDDRISGRELEENGIEIGRARIDAARIGIVIGSQAGAGGSGRGKDLDAGIARGAQFVARAGLQLQHRDYGTREVWVGQGVEGYRLGTRAGREIERTRQRGMVHPFGGEARAGAAEGQVHGDVIERESAASDREETKVDGGLTGIGLVRGRVSGGDGKDVLGSKPADDVGVIRERLAIEVEGAIAGGVQRIEAELIFFPVIHAVPVGIDIGNGDPEELGGADWRGKGRSRSSRSGR